MTRLRYLSEKRILTSLVVLLQLNRYFGLVYRHWKLARSLRLIQLTEIRLTQRKKWRWPEVASYEEHSWVSTKVLSKKLILFSMYHKKTTWSGAYSFILDGFKWVCPLLCSWPQRLFSGSKSNYFKGYTKEASLAMYYWATDFKPDLTHGSIIKSEALAPESFFKTWFVDVRISSC